MVLSIKFLKSLNVPVVVTVAYRLVKGKAKNYPYTGAKYYYARKRQKDDIMTWRPLYDANTPDRRSKRLALLDAQNKARQHKITYVPGVRLGSFVRHNNTF